MLQGKPKQEFLVKYLLGSQRYFTPIPQNNQVARQEDAKERANKSQLSSEVYSFDFAIAVVLPLFSGESVSKCATIIPLEKGWISTCWQAIPLLEGNFPQMHMGNFAIVGVEDLDFKRVN